MNTRTARTFVGCYVAVVLLGAVALAQADASAQDIAVELDPAQTRIAFTLGDVLHTVHGTFKLKSGIIHFNPATGAASGLIVVDTTSGDTGSKSRDRKMHKEILESAKYPDATFQPTHVTGQFNPGGASTMQVAGVFRLHGSDHPVNLVFPVQARSGTVSMSTQMVIPYVKWGLKNPSTFILRVSDKLDLDIQANGHLVGPTQARAAR